MMTKNRPETHRLLRPMTTTTTTLTTLLTTLLAFAVVLLLAACGSEPDSTVQSQPDGDLVFADFFGGISADTGGQDKPDGESGGTNGIDTAAANTTDTLGTDAGPGSTIADTTAACPGGSGCPCNGNDECDNALCIDTPAGKRCAYGCIDTCPDGLKCAQVSGDGNDVVSICVTKDPHLCNPCSASTACISLGAGDGLCVDHGDAGAFCGVACVDAAGCSAGYSCVDVSSIEGAKAKQCVPTPDKKNGDKKDGNKNDAAMGTCTCSPAAVASKLSTTCAIAHTTSAGTVKCAGKVTCEAEGPASCAAPKLAEEVCDGMDNDCDGDIDESTCDDKNACTKDSCEGAKGCSNTALTDGLTCDADGNGCTVKDSCQGGSCTPGALKDCDDGNPCTKDACALNVGCTQVFDNGTPCSDDNPCTIGDVCKAGSCGAGVAKTCASGKPCVIGECSLKTGKCGFSDKQDGKSCDDKDACTQSDGCKTGKCVGVVGSCDDGNACTIDACKPAVGCSNTKAPGLCSDGDPCTVKDSCVAGLCTSGPAKKCSDNNICTVDACDGKSGECSNLGASLEGKACDGDGSICTQSDACKKGACTLGAVLDCDDKNPCTMDTCHAKLGCQHKATTGSCDADGDACTVGDSCNAGVCKVGKTKSCDDNNACTVDGCAGKTGKCTYDPGPLHNKVCDADGSKCTVKDVCKIGICTAGTAKSCSDGKSCTEDTCVPSTGVCEFSSPPFDGQGCDDGNACTVNDSCTNGTCTGVGQNCNDNNPCTTDTCTKAGGCVNSAVGNGTGCGGGKVCQSGACVTNTVCTVTWDPLQSGSAIIRSKDNMVMGSVASWNAARGTLGHSAGKWYYEMIAKVGPYGFSFIGAGNKTARLNGCCTGNAGSWGYYGNSGIFRGLGVNSPKSVPRFRNGTFVIGVALDLDTHRIWWSLNGSWLAGGNPAAGANPAYSNLTGVIYPQASVALSQSVAALRACSSTFKYAPPAGFLPWGG